MCSLVLDGAQHLSDGERRPLLPPQRKHDTRRQPFRTARMLRHECETGICRRRAHPSAHRTRHDPGPTAAALAPSSGEVRASRCIRPEYAEGRLQAADPVLASSMLPCVSEMTRDRRQWMAKPLLAPVRCAADSIRICQCPPVTRTERPPHVVVRRPRRGATPPRCK